jgi:hypothetical protein
MKYCGAVIRARQWLTLGSCGVLLVAAARAEVDASNEPAKPAFLARNPFGLKPIPTNVVTAAPTSPPPVKVDLKLAGITVDASGKRAWLVQLPTVARPGVPAVTNQTYFTIAEGGRQGDVEVLAINPKENTVRIMNAGVEVTLDFINNGLAAPPPMMANQGGAAGQPRGIPAAGIPGAPAAASTLKPTAAKPVAGMPSPGGFGGGAVANPPAAALAADTMMASRYGLPARNVRTGPEASPVAAPPVDPAAQLIMVQAQQEAARAAGRPYPPPPPLPGLAPRQ